MVSRPSREWAVVCHARTVTGSGRTRRLTACLAVALIAGCGGQGEQGARSGGPSDADLAAEIRDSARQRQAERAEKAREAADEVRAREAARKKTVTTLPPPVDLPAGSDEIDGGPETSGDGPAGLISSADRASFARLASELSGEEGLALTPLDRERSVVHLGTLRTGVAWSTAKVPVVMAAISAGVGAQADFAQAITASDNAAAQRVWEALGGGDVAARAATEQLRAAGDATTQIQSRQLRPGFSAFGQTTWRLSDQARFAAGMACTGPGAAVLALMERVVAGQRWGLGSTGRVTQFKAGWGPGISAGAGDGWLDRQFGLVSIGGRPIAVAIASTANDHGTGTQNLTRIAQWLVSHLDATGASRRATC